MKKLFAFLLVCLILSVGSVAWAIHHQYTKGADSFNSTLSNTVSSNPEESTSGTKKVAIQESEIKGASSAKPEIKPSVAATPLPETKKVSVPYTMQAPFNKWDPLHEDACEEASLMMVKHFLSNTPIASPEAADKEITALVKWEEEKGYDISITLDQLNQVAKDYYGLNNGTVVKVTSIDQIKQELANGHPLILGMAGKLLPNPYFSNGGPNYHMLVAKGYDATSIITNEPGTFHGDGFVYKNDVFYNAVHDWNSSNILNGQKAYLVFK